LHSPTPPGKHSPHAALIIGLVFIAIGFPFVLMWAGLIAPDRAKLSAPLWVVGCAGLAFMMAGLAVAVNAASPAMKRDGSLPDTAPKALRILQDLASIGIVGMLALLASWAALAPGEIRSSRSVAGVTQTASDQSTFGRVVFGLGAICCWLFVLWIVRQVWRKYTTGPQPLP
jgi:hypothetical protein